MKQIRLLLTGLFLILTAGMVSAQNIRVTGTVTDEGTGEPVGFAYVQVKGTMQGTSTDDMGRYEITTAPDAVLLFSFVGYTTSEVPVNGRASINVALLPDAILLDDVVLTAYGPQAKKGFTGSAAIVKADVIENLQVSSISKALQGVASGVMVINSSGQPGENATIRIRGVGSFGGSMDPLIVLDGVIYEGNLNSINPNDIESFTILKDANSTALYGSKAANGVLVITTKIGRPGKANFNFSATYGMSQRAVADYNYLNSEQFLETAWKKLWWDAEISSSVTDPPGEYASNSLMGLMVYNPYYPETQPVGTDGKIKAGAKANYSEDWYDALFRTGQRQEYNLSASGGTKEVRYFISGGYLGDEGMVKMSKFDRYTMRAKIDANLTSWLSTGINTSLAYSYQNFPTQGGTSVRNSMLFVRSVPSIYPAYVRDKDGAFILKDGEKQYDYGRDTVWGFDRPIFAGSNPLATFAYDDIGYRRLMTNNSGFLQAVWKDFTFKTTLGVDILNVKTKSYYNNIIGDGTAYGGRSMRAVNETFVITWSNLLTYDKIFNRVHHVNILAGTDSYENNNNYLELEKRGFDFADQELTYGATPITATSTTTSSRDMRYLARAMYDYDDRYHISASWNMNGTSKFYKDARWGHFWSVGAAWNIANESFMAGTRDFIDQLKLRVSYGTSGNQNIGTGRFPYMATYDTGWDILGNLGSIVNTLGNNYLTWEKQGMLDIGVDFVLLGSRLSGSVGYYDKKSDDILMSRPLPISAGITSYNDNIGAMRNQGIEVDLKGVLMQKRDLYWDLGVNFAWQKNEITSLPDEVATGMYWDSYKRNQVGYSRYSWWLQEWAGVDPEDGAPMWYHVKFDEDGNELSKETTKDYSQATRTYQGTSLPKWIGGISTNFKWKGLYAQVMASFSLGGYIYDSDYSGLMHGFVSDRMNNQAHEDILNAWATPGQITDVPRLNSTNGNSASTRFLYKNDYLRIRNITVGYDLASIPSLRKIGFGALKIYFAAENPFTFFGGPKGLDPEAGIHAITSNTSSALKVYSFGLNLQF